MKLSASILAANQNDIFSDISKHDKKFDMLHIDIGDNIFCPTYGISYDLLNEINNTTEYILDVHLMIENPQSFFVNISELKLDSVTVHCEAITVSEFINLNKQNFSLGIGILISTPLTILEDYLDKAASILLLCVKPGFSNQEPILSPIERVKEFKTLYPDYIGNISVDGGVKNSMLEELEDLGVGIAVQGGAIFAD